MRLPIFLFVISLAAGSLTAADRPSFSGTWLLDSAHSTGDVPDWSGMSISQDSHWFRMAQVDKAGRTIRNVEGECRTDGRFHPVEGAQGGSISCKWDGTTLVSEQHWNNDANRKTVRTMLAPDGKLIQEITSTGPAGAKEAHIVWMRQ